MRGDGSKDFSSPRTWRHYSSLHVKVSDEKDRGMRPTRLKTAMGRVRREENFARWSFLGGRGDARRDKIQFGMFRTCRILLGFWETSVIARRKVADQLL